MFDHIKKAIEDGEDFLAHKMLLIRDEGKSSKDAAWAAWAEGEAAGVKRMAAYLGEAS